MATTTIRDVARHAGVGVGTVSRVLNNKTAVSARTREAVLAAIDELDYTPNQNARRLSLGKTLTIAVIAPYLTRPSVVERLRGISAALADSPYDLALFNVETPARYRRAFKVIPRRERYDGLIIISLTPNDHDAAAFRRGGLPVILLDAEHPDHHSVVVDDVAGGRLATQHLLDLGHRRIAFLSDTLKNSFNFVANRRRYEGYHQALDAAGVPIRPSLLVEGEHGRASARQLSHRLLTSAERPTAIFAASDIQAIGTLESARALNIAVPGDLSVIGYDDIEMADLMQLTTIRQGLFSSGEVAGRMMLSALTAGAETPFRRRLPTTLIERATTASSCAAG